MHNVLSEQNSIVNQFLSEIRDVTIQKDSLRFRRNMERIGEFIAYELSKRMEFEEKIVQTPIAQAKTKVLKQQPVIGTIMRAGLVMHSGLHRVFDKAENAFVSAYRDEHKNGSFDIVVQYMASPSLEEKILIISDPMLATGGSMVASYEALLKNGTPKKTYVVAAIGSRKGVEYVEKNMPENTEIWIGAIDEELNPKKYIVPGLGDAGDLAFGGKI